MPPDPFDADALGSPVTDADLKKLKQAPARARLPRPRKGEQYLGGPIPMGWESSRWRSKRKHFSTSDYRFRSALSLSRLFMAPALPCKHRLKECNCV